MDWAEPRAFVTRLLFRLRSMAFGETLRSEGEVTQIRSSIVVVSRRLTSGSRLVCEAETEARLRA
ncbi:hypothetical protein BSN85_31870 [Bradyrhizobium brasilense]|nr:hypothetical protein BSN85_31870 [Bradyrhizobium brasilense]